MSIGLLAGAQVCAKAVHSARMGSRFDKMKSASRIGRRERRGESSGPRAADSAGPHRAAAARYAGSRKQMDGGANVRAATKLRDRITLHPVHGRRRGTCTLPTSAHARRRSPHSKSRRGERPGVACSSNSASASSGRASQSGGIGVRRNFACRLSNASHPAARPRDRRSSGSCRTRRTRVGRMATRRSRRRRRSSEAGMTSHTVHWTPCRSRNSRKGFLVLDEGRGPGRSAES